MLSQISFRIIVIQEQSDPFSQLTVKVADLDLFLIIYE